MRAVSQGSLTEVDCEYEPHAADSLEEDGAELMPHPAISDLPRMDANKCLKHVST